MNLKMKNRASFRPPISPIISRIPYTFLDYVVPVDDRIRLMLRNLVEVERFPYKGISVEAEFVAKLMKDF